MAEGGGRHPRLGHGPRLIFSALHAEGRGLGHGLSSRPRMQSSSDGGARRTPSPSPRARVPAPVRQGLLVLDVRGARGLRRRERHSIAPAAVRRRERREEPSARRRARSPRRREGRDLRAARDRLGPREGRRAERCDLPPCRCDLPPCTCTEPWCRCDLPPCTCTEARCQGPARADTRHGTARGSDVGVGMAEDPSGRGPACRGAVAWDGWGAARCSSWGASPSTEPSARLNRRLRVPYALSPHHGEDERGGARDGQRAGARCAGAAGTR
jgi:hypothetical protein